MDDYTFERNDRYHIAYMYFSAIDPKLELTDVNRLIQNALSAEFKHYGIKDSKIIENKRVKLKEVGHAILNKDLDIKAEAEYDILDMCQHVKITLERKGIKKVLEYRDEQINEKSIKVMEAIVKADVSNAFFDLFPK